MLPKPRFYGDTIEDSNMKAILGKKVGMTQVYECDENGALTGKIVPVTVVEAGPCVVVQKRTKENDGYEAIQLGFGDIRSKLVNKPRTGHFKKANCLKRYLREFRCDDIDAYEVGQEIKADIFQKGDVVDVTGTSKGKGFQGGMKRHNFGGGGNSHGSMSHRVPASSGATDAARVFPGTLKPGHMGNVRVTAQALTVVDVIVKEENGVKTNVMLIKGSVPGANQGLVAIRSSVKNRK